ncbi:uncharacterized protein TNCV_46531 [Trichonephila clavipes]|nr:uncharacterized protein TNCV_46531 [Trichonephila clavipes]
MLLTIRELRLALQDEWAAMPQLLIDTLILSMGRRCETCLAVREIILNELWFQQDGATCHTARATIDLLKDTLGDRLISRFGPVNWPPRSCDLTWLDYFLWGYVKSLVYADKPQTLDHLEDNIRRVIADMRPQMLENSSKIGRSDWTTSEPAVAVPCHKSCLKLNRMKKREHERNIRQIKRLPHNRGDMTLPQAEWSIEAERRQFRKEEAAERKRDCRCNQSARVTVHPY